jgi:hypothetical protein
MELARGCPFRCAFCFESKGTARVRRFPLARIAAELDRFRAAGVEEVFVLDPTFNADGKRFAEAVRLMAEKGRGLRFVLELRAELLDRTQAKLLADLDCSVQIGLQSSDPAVLAGVDRSFDPAIFARKVRLLEEYGVVYGLDLIYGLPGDDPAGFMRSLDYALALAPNHLDVFRLAVLPGTALGERAASQGLVYDHLAPHLVRSTPTFPAAALDRADRIAAALDLLYNRGRAVVWFPALSKALGMKPSAIIEPLRTRPRRRGLALGSRGSRPADFAAGWLRRRLRIYPAARDKPPGHRGGNHQLHHRFVQGQSFLGGRRDRRPEPGAKAADPGQGGDRPHTCQRCLDPCPGRGRGDGTGAGLAPGRTDGLCGG